MLLAQGWKDKKIYCIVLSRATNGFDGWQVYRGVYDPANKETFEHAQWECLSSSKNIIELLYYAVFSEMMTWADGDVSVKDLKTVLESVNKQCGDIANYVGKACGLSSSV